jgi:hypothetical protein
MESVYHIVAIRVNETSWAHVWRLRFRYLAMGYDIKIAYNPCEHSRTKHIDIRHYFLRDHVIKGDIVISHVRTNE